MGHPMWRLAAILGALIATSAVIGAALYEETVLDTVWPHRPDIVRPIEGGANRKHFWAPANLIVILSLLAATWAAWPLTSARNAVLVGVGLYAIILAVTVAYFVPALLKVERMGAPPDDPASRDWVRRNRWRSALAFGANLALSVAVASLASVN